MQAQHCPLCPAAQPPQSTTQVRNLRPRSPDSSEHTHHGRSAALIQLKVDRFVGFDRVPFNDQPRQRVGAEIIMYREHALAAPMNTGGANTEMVKDAFL